MNRRSFLGVIIATCAAPAIVRASSLMPVRAAIRPLAYNLSSMPGYREMWQYDISLDNFRIRIDTWDGVNQFHVDFRAPVSHQYLPSHQQRFAQYQEAKRQALEVLSNHVRLHDPLTHYYAPPMPIGYFTPHPYL